MVEGAFTLVVFLSLVFGVCEFGRAIWIYTLICHVAREGTRYAAVHGGQSGMTSSTAISNTNALVKARAVGLPASKVNVTTTWVPSNAPGNAVKVAVTYDFKFMTPYRLTKNTLTLRSTSQMMVTN
jgi:hypothetical protein